MKFITLFSLLLLASMAQAQVSINVGLTSRLQGAFKAAVERQTGWNNTELSTMVSSDNLRPVIGLQTGYSTLFDFQTQANIRILAGAFYHTGLLPMKSDARCPALHFGGSVRLELNDGLVSLGYNGETINLTIGFIFKRRN